LTARKVEKRLHKKLRNGKNNLMLRKD